jgi:hypothetical protein
MTEQETIRIADAIELPPMSGVSRIVGTVKVAFPPRSGTSIKTGYPWHRQGFVLTDGKHEITCTIWGRADLNMEKLTGQEVVISTPRSSRSTRRPVETVEGKCPRTQSPRLELSINKDAIVVPVSGGVPEEYRK